MRLRPSELVLRCMGYRTRRGTWVAKCIDFDLTSEGGSMKESQEILLSMIDTYLQSVLETSDRDSIPRLLLRKSLIRDRILFHIILAASRWDHWRMNFSTFTNMLPINLGTACR